MFFACFKIETFENASKQMMLIKKNTDKIELRYYYQGTRLRMISDFFHWIETQKKSIAQKMIKAGEKDVNVALVNCKIIK